MRTIRPPIGLFKGMLVTLKTLFTKPATTHYPLEKEVLVPGRAG